MPTSVYTKNNIAMASDWIQTNNTFSGCDMVATVTMRTDKGEVTRYIGSLQTVSISTSQNKVPVRCLGDINAKDYVDGPRTIAGSLIFTVFDEHWTTEFRKALIEFGVYKNHHILADEMPPFDITINFENEYGYGSYMAIKGVRLLNEGQTMSINDIYTENTYQYVAMDLKYMESMYYINGESDDIPANIQEASGDVTDAVKPIETIPNTSDPEIVPRPPVSPTLEDDFSYSRIYPDAYIDIKLYKKALDEQRQIYISQISAIYNPYNSEHRPQYDALMQRIDSGYSAKIKEGIENFNAS